MMSDMPVKYPVPTGDRWAMWKWCDIPSEVNEGQVYLRRLRVINTPWFSVMVHWINEADTGRWFHDHPWTFWSFILQGNYHEEIYPDTDRMYKYELPPLMNFWGRYSIHRMPFAAAHKIVHASDNLITLVVTGRRRRRFRFWTDKRPIVWDKVYPPEVNDVD